MSKCNKCNKELPDEMFYSTYKYKRHICKTCENRRKTVWVREKGRQLKIESVNLLGGKCLRCGYNKCIQALEFHHLNRKDKEERLSELFRKYSNLNKILPELKKCILLCANCHREETVKEENALLAE